MNASLHTLENTTDTRPAYETPAVRIMTETEILNTFQITQAMATWWTNNGSPFCPAGC